MKTFTVDDAKSEFEKSKGILKAFSEEDLSETDTRSKLIDKLLIDVLKWQEPFIEREPHQAESGKYIDYKLSTTRRIYIIEAKRVQNIYDLPKDRNRHTYKSEGVLIEDKSLKRDLEQTRNYAYDSGVTFCCLTNGIQFLFFRPSNMQGIDWKNHEIIIFRDHDDILSNFNLFYELLSYDAVSSGRTFHALPINRESAYADSRFLILERPENPKRTQERNKLFPLIKEVIDEAFQDLSGKSASPELIKQCYVESSRDSSYGDSLEALVKDRSIFVDRSTTTLEVDKKSAGEFDRILDGSRDSEVILLLGGVGSGKSTFIQRFRLVLAREIIEKSCIWAYIDLNAFSDTGDSLTHWIKERIISECEEHFPSVGLTNYENLKQAYHKEYERLKNGKLKPIYERDPSEFEVRFSDQLDNFEEEHIKFISRLLQSAGKRSGKRPFLVFDNADQYHVETQDSIFRIAQEMAKEVRCSAIISLREESYWKNKDFGTLSAFHAKTFHVRAPRLDRVLSKRFKYVEKRLSQLTFDGYQISEHEAISDKELLGVFQLLRQTALGEDSQIVRFLECISPGEVRRPLDHLSRFLYSGHTNVDSLVRAARTQKQIVIGFHEFLVSVALGDQAAYSDETSDVVNLFKVMGRGDESNLNLLVILSRILSEQNNPSSKHGFLPIDSLVSDCERVGIVADTCLEIVERLNKKRLVESSTQNKEEVGEATMLRATPAANYYCDHLGSQFSYVDLILPDVEIGNKSFYSQINKKTRNIIKNSAKSKKGRLQRIKERAERANLFGKYIESEINRKDLSSLPESFHSSAFELLRGFRSRLNRDCQRALQNAGERFG